MLSPLLISSCEDANAPAIDNLVFFNEASAEKSLDVTMQEGVTVANVTVRLARAISKDVVVHLKTDSDYLRVYNERNESSIKEVEPAHVKFPESVVIKAGTTSAEPVKLEISSFETAGAQFAIPFTIASVDGGIEKSVESSRIMLNLIKPLKQQVPAFRWYNGMSTQKEWNNLELMNYTLEWWCRISSPGGGEGYSVNNQAIINSGSGTTEMYIRFGDLVYTVGGRYVYNFLQVKTMGAQFDTGDPAQGAGLLGKTWMHFALTYDAATGTSLLYKDGVQVNSLKTAAGKPMIISRFSMISSGAQYFRDICEMCQVRFWKTTRTANQIQKSMFSEVDYHHPDLIFYLPMNETEGAKLNDVTGNGYDVEIGSLFPEQANSKEVTRKEYSFNQ